MEKPRSDKSFSFRQRIHSFGYAFRGLLFMMKTQHNFRIHFTITALVIVAGFFFHISLTEWVLVIFSIGMVLSAETFNSAIEQLTDLASPDFHPTAGRVKDLAAAAVLLSAIAAFFIGVLIFAPKILALL